MQGLIIYIPDGIGISPAMLETLIIFPLVSVKCGIAS